MPSKKPSFRRTSEMSGRITRHSLGLGIVAQGVAACRLGDARLQHGRPHGLLHAAFVHMVPSLLCRSRVNAELSSGEDVLPAPFEGGIRIFSRKGMGQKDACASRRPIAFERRAACEQVPAQRDDELIGHGDDAVLGAFAVAYDDGAMAEIQVLHPHPDAFQQTQPGAVLQTSDQPVDSRQALQHSTHFLDGEHDRQPLRAFRTYDLA